MNKAIVITSQFVGMLLSTMAIASDIHGRFDIGSGYTEHPLGLRNDTAAGYLNGVLFLSNSLATDTHMVKLGYEGTATLFGQETDLGSRRHALGIEWHHGMGSRRDGLSAGVQVSTRNHDGYYEIYDYAEGYGYFAFKSYLDERTLGRGYAALRIRRYGDLPEESYVEPHAHLELQRYAESRTTLGLAVDYGVKIFDDASAPRIWDTPDTPATSQIAARLNFAQGISDRVALRGWIGSLWNLSDFPHYVNDNVYDSPVLDHYAYDGLDSRLILKILGPVQTWLEVGGSWGRHDYGEMLFASEGGGSVREDDVATVFLGVERRLGGGPIDPRLRLHLGWRDQDSIIPNYDYAGSYFTSSLSLDW
ncbi:hypothetical protein KKA85_03945 [bacterium]|nr:hypothetical protein [bacterium]MBU1674913.1 hypothetical protein [bacterium]